MHEDSLHRLYQNVIVPMNLPSANRSKNPKAKALYKQVGELENEAEAVWGTDHFVEQDTPEYFEKDDRVRELTHQARYLADQADHLSYALDDTGELTNRYNERRHELDKSLMAGGALAAAAAGIAAIQTHTYGKVLGGLAAGGLGFGIYQGMKNRDRKDDVRERAMDHYREKYGLNKKAEHKVSKRRKLAEKARDILIETHDHHIGE